jgi:6-phosphogluconolactonase (cycloisomerase 2 family)
MKHQPKPPHSIYSRRSFLKGGAALALTPSHLAWAQSTVAPITFAYVGTYTGAPGSGSNGEGIYRFDMDTQTGRLAQRTLVAKTPSPSWIAIHHSRKYLYAVNEVSSFQGNSGSVSAFAIDSVNGDLKPLNTVSSEGATPAYLSLDASGKFAFVANYGGASLAVLPIQPDGLLAPAVDVHRDSGQLGNVAATDAPHGSFAVSGHDAPHLHCIAPAPGNRFVLATDLGQDRIYRFRFDVSTGKLTPAAATPYISFPSGDGPRHFAFHPNGRWLYSIQEESSTIVFLRYEPQTGSLASQQTVSTLPATFSGTSFASEILVSADGRFVYAANRLHDSIAVFSIGPNGMLTHIGQTRTEGDYPRQCAIDPSGRFLYVCNQHSDSITSFRIDRSTGLLTFTSDYIGVGSPASITFLS